MQSVCCEAWDFLEAWIQADELLAGVEIFLEPDCPLLMPVETWVISTAETDT